MEKGLTYTYQADEWENSWSDGSTKQTRGEWLLNKYRRYNIGETAPQREQTYTYPSFEDNDEKIYDFVEEKRTEFYEAWYEYIKDFEWLFFNTINKYK